LADAQCVILEWKGVIGVIRTGKQLDQDITATSPDTNKFCITTAATTLPSKRTHYPNSLRLLP
jgi:hypothetical protein